MQPDFEKLNVLLASQNVFSSVPEIHGIITGQVSAGAGYYQPELTWRLLGMEGEASKVMVDLMRRLEQDIIEQMEASDFPFYPLLPDDDEELGPRLEALGRWCEGFGAGFGAGFGKGDSALSDETREVLSDFAAIANVEEQPDAGGEQDEKDFMEVVEYIRMAATTVYLRNNKGGPPRGQSQGENQDLH